MTKHFYYLFFCLLLSSKLFGQTDFTPQIGLSPNVASIEKFQQVAVSPYTGTANISIPLYTITVDDFEMPIVLRYHTSGIKVNEEASWVGLGWDLSPTGRLSHYPIGTFDQRDELPSKLGYDILMQTGFTNQWYNSYISRNENADSDADAWSACSSPDILTEDNWEALNYAASQKLGMPDIFHYSYPNGSGSFYLDPEDHSQTVLFGKKDSENFIEHNMTNSPISYTDYDWQVTDLSGVKYIYDRSDVEWSSDLTNSTLPLNNNYQSVTWWLSNIQLQNGKQINMTYSDGLNRTHGITSSYYDKVTASGIDTKYQLDEHHVKYTSSIETEKEIIEFELSTTQEERKDIDGNLDGTEYSAKRLNAIHIWDKINNRRIKSYEFYYDFFDCSESTTNDFEGYRLRLNSLKEVGYSDDGLADYSKPAYVFTYNDDSQFPKKNSYEIDFWGHYNGESSNTGLVPKLKSSVLSGFININNLPGSVVSAFYDKGNSNRGMSPEHAKTNILERIDYPTGMYQQLDYEANCFSNYHILSAEDFDYGNEMYGTISYAIFNDNNIQPSSHFYPDENGVLNLLDFKINIAPLMGVNTALQPEQFSWSQVELFRVNTTGDTTCIYSWTVPLIEDDSILVDGYEISEPLFTYDSVDNTPSDIYFLRSSFGSLMTYTESVELDVMASIACSGSYLLTPDTAIFSQNSIGGGLRIKKQSTYDFDGELQLRRTYSYLNDDSTTSGKLITPLKIHSFYNYKMKTYTCSGDGSFHITEKDYYNFIIGSNNLNSFSMDINGVTVGYGRVEIVEEDDMSNTNGKTVSNYRNKPSTAPSMYYYKNTGSLPAISYEDTGLLDSTLFYNSEDELIKKVENTYQCFADIMNKGVVVVDTYVGPDECGVPCPPLALGIVNYFAFNPRWEIYYYPLQAQMFKLENSKEYLFDSDDNFIVQDNTYDYNTFGQLIETSHISSSNDEYSSQYLYPQDINTGIYASMVSENMYDYPIERIHTKNNDIVGSELITYKTSDSIIVPSKVFSLNPSTTLASFTEYDGSTMDSNYSDTPEMEYLDYDSYGNILKTKGIDGIYTYYLWGYNNYYPVAKIVSSQDVTISLSVDDSSLSESNSHLNINNDVAYLKSLLSTYVGNNDYLVTIYTYNPLVGMSSQTNPSGTTTYYNYDSLNRLRKILNDDGEITAQYYYHYVTGDPIDLIQMASLNVSIDSLLYTSLPETKTFDIISDTDWTVSTTDAISWLSISPTSGSGDGTITAVASENTGSEDREATIEISCDSGITRFIYVTQEAADNCYLSVSPTSFNIPSSGGSNYSFNIYSNCEWTVSESSSWITGVSLTSGSGDGNVSFDVLENTNTSSRSATIEIIRDSEIIESITVYQQGESISYYLNVSPTSLDFPASGSSLPFSISSNDSWNVSESSSWLSCSPLSGPGNGTVSVSTLVNSGSIGRSGTITITGVNSGITRTVSIYQGYLYVTPTSISASDAGGNESFNIISDCSWSTSESSAILNNLSPTSGSGNSTVSFTVDENMNTSSRSGSISIAGDGVTKIVAVTQEAADPIPTLSVSPSSLSFSNLGGASSFSITSNDSWSISNPASWLSRTPTSGTNNATISVTASQNNSTSSRSATFTISSGSGLSETVTVSQPGETLTVSPSSFTVGGGSSTTTISVSSNTSWVVSESESWIDLVNTNQGTGNGSFGISTWTLSSGFRYGFVTVQTTDGLISRTIMVYQDANY